MKPWRNKGENSRISLENFAETSREHCRGSLRGDPMVRFVQKSSIFRGHFRGHLRVHSGAHFREHFRERVCGSNFAVRVLCAFLIGREREQRSKNKAFVANETSKDIKQSKEKKKKTRHPAKISKALSFQGIKIALCYSKHSLESIS